MAAGSYLASVPNTISDFASVGTGPLGLSAVLQAMAATSTIDAHDNNNVQFNATPVGGIAVFDVTAAALQGYAGFKVNLDGASTVVINVDASGTGGLVNLNNHFNNEFHRPSERHLELLRRHLGQFRDAVGRPDARAGRRRHQLDRYRGRVLVAGSFNGRGELHDYAFLGTSRNRRRSPNRRRWRCSASASAAFGLLRRRRR